MRSNFWKCWWGAFTGTLFAYLGDSVSCSLVSFQVQLFDGEKDESN